MWNPFDIAPTGDKPFTDYSRWRLLVNDGGRHTWHYLRTEEELANWPQNEVDKFWLGLDTARIISSNHHMNHEPLNQVSLTGFTRITSGGGCSACSP